MFKLINKHDKEAMSIILVIWTIISGIILGIVFGLFSTPFFRFGPSDNLYTIGTNYNINNWYNYIFISIFLVVQGFITSLVADSLYPWIYSVVLNPDISEIKVPKIKAWIITNNTFLLYTCLQLLSLGMSMTQIDLFIYSNGAGLVAGWIQSYIRLRSKTYPIEDIELEEVV